MSNSDDPRWYNPQPAMHASVARSLLAILAGLPEGWTGADLVEHLQAIVVEEELRAIVIEEELRKPTLRELVGSVAKLDLNSKGRIAIGNGIGTTQLVFSDSTTDP
jgi:hypothetical protein